MIEFLWWFAFGLFMGAALMSSWDSHAIRDANKAVKIAQTEMKESQRLVDEARAMLAERDKQ